MGGVGGGGGGAPFGTGGMGGGDPYGVAGNAPCGTPGGTPCGTSGGGPKPPWGGPWGGWLGGWVISAFPLQLIFSHAPRYAKSARPHSEISSGEFSEGSFYHSVATPHLTVSAPVHLCSQGRTGP
ncbi:hypothetical protein GCM10009540_43490 [Streptomyces turgidiscabies]